MRNWADSALMTAYQAFMLMRSPVPQFASIQILRAVAALAITIHHGMHEADLAARKSGGTFDWQFTLPLEAGVDLFFVISGFVMVHASRDLFGSPASILPFLRRRLARIVPIYWMTTLAFLVLTFGGLSPATRPFPSAEELTATFLFIPYVRPDGYLQPLYGLGWTLNYEMFFYLLFALVLPWPREKAVPALVLVLMLLVAAGHLIPASQTAPHFWTRSIILEFGLGMIIGQMALSGVQPTRPAAAALALAALALFAFGSFAPALLPDRALLYGLPSALLVMAALALDDAKLRHPLAKGLRNLGDASYALYLLHPFALKGLTLLAGTAIAALSPLLFLILGVTLACIAAMIVWRGFEKPLTRALQGPKQT
jgi:exopolysaccharide production protein ExoZ